ncbi:hypothetical protein [Maricaulis sp.]|jgi:hypothetical protein|uniref:hypothetical protein n=1 Tax=Maricaulis sp. TaxID=1486257 RepID=UPI001B0B376F|nr:hypothetical protein [Maricaulis sp.]MBO6764311.1 protein activator of alkane oxidation PraB [Maricaulis sp.]
MKLKPTLMAALFGVAVTTAPALATWPPGTTPTISGTLTLSQSTTIDCDVTVDLSISGSGVPTITSRSFSPGDWPCGVLVNPTGTWTITPGPGTNKVTLSIGATSILGSCSGTVQADFNTATNTITFNNVSVPGTPNACTVNGSLS